MPRDIGLRLLFTHGYTTKHRKMTKKPSLMPKYWPSHSFLRGLFNTYPISISILMKFRCFFLHDFYVCMMVKTTVLFIYIHIRVKSIVLALSIKFCVQSGLAIKRTNTISKIIVQQKFRRVDASNQVYLNSDFGF